MSVRTFAQLPKMHTTYANVIKSLIPSRDTRADSLPDAVFEVAQLKIDLGNLKEYRKICGFGDDGRVPATYFAVLSQNLQMNMMANEQFPFAMLGLIHLHNEVTQYRVIYDSEMVRMTVQLANLRAHDKGQQFDFVTHVYRDDVLIWQGVSTYLSRQKIQKPKESAKPKKQPPQAINVEEYDLHKTIVIPEDIGRRYAFVSGDFNFIHLHPLSAKAFGYPRAIAHGMWSKAMALASLRQLDDAFCCRVDFLSPIFLPSTVEWVARDEENGVSFALVSQNKVHLLGTITAV